MFNVTLISIASLATIGIVELIKIFLPANTNAKIKAVISLVLSVGSTVGFGLLMKQNALTIIMSGIAVVGLVQCSYDFILKLLKTKIEDIKARVQDEALQFPLLKKQIEKEINRLENGGEPCDCEDCADKA